MTLEEYFRVIGDRTLRKVKAEMDRETEGLRRRLDEGERKLMEMVETQRKRVEDMRRELGRQWSLRGAGIPVRRRARLERWLWAVRVWGGGGRLDVRNL